MCRTRRNCAGPSPLTARATAKPARAHVSQARRRSPLLGGSLPSHARFGGRRAQELLQLSDRVAVGGIEQTGQIVCYKNRSYRVLATGGGIGACPKRARLGTLGQSFPVAWKGSGKADRTGALQSPVIVSQCVLHAVTPGGGHNHRGETMVGRKQYRTEDLP